jgi:hypothetical protein
VAKIHYVVGDATNPINLFSEDEKKIIMHVVNDIRIFGAGFALNLGKKYPQAKNDYLQYGKYFNYDLGSNIYSFCEGICIAHLIAQKGVIGYDNPQPLKYYALSDCFRSLYLDLNDSNQEETANISIHAPRLGCGLAGGDWKKVEEIIQEKLVDEGIDVVIYDLPK